MKVKFIKYYAGGFLVLIVGIVFLYRLLSRSNYDKMKKGVSANSWHAPDTSQLTFTGIDSLIRYGRALISNTAAYLGPKGSVAHISNGMNCQNCHLDAGTRLFGGNFALVASTYPKYRERSGRFESIEYRINECLQRSLNGKKIDSLSTEMRAMVAYIKWVGKNVPKGTKPPGTDMEELPYLKRAADTAKGRVVYTNKCRVCHSENGQGVPAPDTVGYVYPPLWGVNSFNVSAGMYRISRMADFVKYNMPYKVVAEAPQLSNEEAWDVSAFVNSQQRTQKFFPSDWPNISTKPVDHPFGPYADSFSVQRHKFGPFQEIKKAKALLQKKVL